MGKFHTHTQILQGNTLFSGKFTQLEIFLHDRRSRRSRQISSLIVHLKAREGHVILLGKETAEAEVVVQFGTS